MTTQILAVQTWSEIQADFKLNWLIYLSMPFVAAVVGWGTKIVALEMMYKPLDFKGIGPIGWQGIVPRRAGKVGSKTIELLTSNLLDPKEILDRIDSKEAVEALRGPLTEAIDEVTRDVADQVRPGLWDSVPEAGKKAIRARLHSEAPAIVDALLDELRTDLGRYVDVQYMAVTTLVRNKEKLVKLMRSMGGSAMGFMRRSGIYFGLGIGLVQMLCWGYFRNPWIMPAFGFGVGSISDYVALNMLFRPMQKTKYLGLISFHGLLHSDRENITRDYGRMMAEDLFSPDIVFDAVLHGPGSEKLFSLVAKHVGAAIDAQIGIASPLVKLTVGSQRYSRAKDTMVQIVLERLPHTMLQAQDYAMKVIDLENTIVDKMNQLTPEEYESILRPVFKDDEKIVIAVGAILGGIVGEIQVVIMEHFGRHAETAAALPHLFGTV